MKDANGFFYYPNPADRKAKVYVRKGAEGIEFRLWHEDRPEMWEKHGWLTFEVIREAAEMFRERGHKNDPTQLYDMRVAEALLK